MPIEDLSQEAELRVKITSDNPKEILDAVAKLNQQLDFANKNVDRLEKNLAGSLSASSTKAGSSTRKLTADQLGLREEIYNQSQAYKSLQDAQNRQKASQEEARRSIIGLSESELPRLRYALYDVATTSLAVSAALTAIGTASLVASASYESAFTNVERTLDPTYANVSGLRQELLQMSREVPKSFQDLSAIATLGNQLGVAGEDIIGFTDVVSKFSTVSGLTAEASAQAFGRLANILGYPIDQIQYLASSIELAGVNSASTDAEIIALAQRLGATATRAGFTADQVVGLASALGSLGVAPERAQGVFETYFNSLNEALSEGGDKLAAFAAITGNTVDQLNSAVRSGDGFLIFQQFLAGLQSADTVQLTAALDLLGLSGLRANEVIGRISQRLPLLQQSFAVAAKGLAEGTELNRQYALMLDDLSSRWKLFTDALLSFAAASGNAVAPALKTLLDVTSQLLFGLTDFISSPVGEWLARLAAGALVAVAAYAGLRGGIFLASASLLALRTAASALGGAGLITSIAGLGKAIGFVKVNADGATASTFTLRGALLALGRATLVIGALQLITELIFNMGGVAQSVGDVFIWVGQNIDGFGRSVVGAANAILNTFNPLASLLGSFGLSFFPTEVGAAFQRVGQDVKNWGAELSGANDGLKDFTPVAYNAYNASDYLAGSFDGLGDSAGGAAEQVRTLVDYADDLSGTIKRAFDIRFGPQSGLDAIGSGWMDIADASEEAARNIADYQAKLAGLAADRAIKEYWLSVAENYGDEKRAAKLRAELAEIGNDQADTQGDLAKEQAKANKTLVGNSRAAIENRATLQGLLDNYSSYITALAASGASQADLQMESARLKQEFIAQATQMGYNRSEIENYAQALDDVSQIIRALPRNVTVTANVDPALQALNEYEARLRSISSGTYGGGTIWPPNTGNTADIVEAMAKIDYYSAAVNTFSQRRPVPMSALDNADSSLSYWKNRLSQLRGYMDGGYTGDGGRTKVAGVVHGGEYVFNERAVNNLGVGNLAYLHDIGQRSSGRSAFAGSRAATGGMVELSPYDRMLLQDIRDRVGVNISENSLQATVNGANANTANRRAS